MKLRELVYWVLVEYPARSIGVVTRRSVPDPCLSDDPIESILAWEDAISGSDNSLGRVVTAIQIEDKYL